METTITTSLPPDELAELDHLRRHQAVSRAEVLREAVRWYARWGTLLPFDDPTIDDTDVRDSPSAAG